MSKGKSGNKYGAKLGSFGNGDHLFEKNVTVIMQAIVDGRPIAVENMSEKVYRLAVDRVLRIGIKNWDSAEAKTKFYQVLSNIQLHMLSLDGEVIFMFRTLLVKTSILKYMTPVHLHLLYILIFQTKLPWDIKVTISSVDLSLRQYTGALWEGAAARLSHSNYHCNKPLTDAQAEEWLAGREILEIANNGTLHACEFKYLDMASGRFCYAWKIYLPVSPQHIQNKLGCVFLDKDGCWNLINAPFEELRFIDTVSLLIYSSSLLLYDVSS